MNNNLEDDGVEPDKKFPTFMVGISILVAAIIILFHSCHPAESTTLTASWYDRASCLKESGQHKMANGKELNDEGFTAASWDYKFGTRIRVTNLKNNKSCIVTITDHGPSRRLYAKGRVLDLSRRSFESIANLNEGVIPIKFELEDGE